MTSYVYRVTQKSTGKHYIGSRKANDVGDDLGKVYFTSSRIVRPLFQSNPNEFDVKIIRRFLDYKTALLFEHRLLQRVGVPQNPLFFNKSRMSKEHILVFSSEETRNKIKEARKRQTPPTLGKRMSETTKAKISKANAGRTPSETARRRMSFAKLGRSRSPEVKEKIRLSMKAFRNR